MSICFKNFFKHHEQCCITLHLVLYFYEIDSVFYFYGIAGLNSTYTFLFEWLLVDYFPKKAKLVAVLPPM